MAATQDQLEKALISADKAGDTEAAKALAAALKNLQNPKNLDFDKMTYAPTVGMDTADRVAAGAGKSIADTGRGVASLTGVMSGDEVKDARNLDRPLMSTAGGQVGDALGTVGQTLLPGGALKAAGAVLKAPALAAAGDAVLIPRTIAGAAGVGGGMGLIQPAENIAERAKNVGIGAGGGALIPAAGRAYKLGMSALEPLYDTGQDRIIGRAITNAAGNDPSLGLKLRTAQEYVPGSIPTVGQAADNSGVASLERTAVATNPEVTTAYGQRMKQQNDARVSLLEGLAGSADTLDLAKYARNEVTGDIRNKALAAANYGNTRTAELLDALKSKDKSIISAIQDAGRYKTFAAQQENLAQGAGVRIASEAGVGSKGPIASGQPSNSPELNVGYNGGTSLSPSAYSAASMPRVPARYTENAQRVPEGQAAANTADAIVAQRKSERDFLGYQLNSLKQAGYSPLNVGQLTDSLDSTLNAPGLRASTVVQKTLSDVKNKLASLADKDGNIDARDLYMVRKEVGDMIATHAKENSNWDQKLTAGLAIDVQKAIDGSLQKAGAGDLWGQYLSKYKEASGPINQMQVAQSIAGKSIKPLDGTLQPAAYARALSDETAKGATGFNGATLENTMAPAQLDSLNAIKADLARADAAKNAGRGAGSDTVQKLAYTNLLEQSGIPTFLRTLAPGQIIGNLGGKAADLIYSKANKELSAKLANTMLDSKQAGNLVDQLTNTQKSQLLKLLESSGSGLTTLGLSAPGLINAQK